MKESISIKNLGPLKNIVIDDIKPFTVLIGESGSGKSTLMKVIALFRWLNKLQNVRSYLKHSNMAKSPFTFTMGDYMRKCGLTKFIKPNTEIVYVTDFPSNRHEINYKNGNLSVGSVINVDDINFPKISFISETRNSIAQRLGNNAGGKISALGFYFDETLNDFDRAEKNLNAALDLPILNLNFQAKKIGMRKQYFIQSKEPNGFSIEYQDSSSGIQNIVPVTLIAQYFSDTFKFEEAFNRSVLGYLSQSDNLTDFKPVKNLSDLDKKIYMHIEEPELSLDPDSQRLLMDDLIKKCFINNKNTMELIIATHSPYITNHLNLLIKKFDKNADGAKFNYDNMAVYQVVDGTIADLKIQNERLINTNLLSETIDDIYDEYNELG
jgi:predicted ATPase